MSECLFCRIAEKQVPADVVYEDEHVIAFRDIRPQAPTHVQIIPRRHVAQVADFDPGSDAPWLTSMLAAAVSIARAEGLTSGFRLVFNNGPDAGQSVWHVHMHLLGGRALQWPPG